MAFIEEKPKNDTEWLSLRKGVITATESSILLGLNPWSSVSELEERKEASIPFENAYTIMGQELEPVVVSLVNRLLRGHSKIEVPDGPYKLFDDDARSFFVDKELGLGATPDAGFGDSLLECKTTKNHNYYKWAYHPPAYYLMQLYTQMFCTGRSHGLLAIMSTDLTQKNDRLNVKMHMHELKRDPWIDDVLVTEVKRYWDTKKEGKQYRVNRKQAMVLELRLRANLLSQDFHLSPYDLITRW